MNERHIEDWKPVIKEVIESKAKELTLLGYGEVTPETVWDCLLTKVWRKETKLMLHQVVEDVFHLSGHVYMTYLTMETYQSDDLMATIAALTDM
ncbi:post-transcriptional regulator [Amphibacillus sp. Q70]|uniref:post-transcriptional regulator n=1 Tax=Amphibacillus sp. Q70 TaxID=3453416 RepID=UPI003F8245F8